MKRCQLLFVTVSVLSLSVCCEIDCRTNATGAPKALFREVSPTSESCTLINLCHSLKEIGATHEFLKATKPVESEKDLVDQQELEKQHRQLIEETFIDTRSISIQAMKDGLTLDGKYPSANGLFTHYSVCFADSRTHSSGSMDFGMLLGNWPVDVVNQLCFSTPEIKAESLIAFLQPQYSEKGDLDAQRMMFEEVLPELLRERGETDQPFLAKFVQFVTGLSYVPHKSVSSFKILVCFENVYKQLGNRGDEPADWLPSVHTCEPSISLPLHAYNGSRERLERALDISMSMSTNELDKN